MLRHAHGLGGMPVDVVGRSAVVPFDLLKEGEQAGHMQDSRVSPWRRCAGLQCSESKCNRLHHGW